jgi:hypothetical protein
MQFIVLPIVFLVLVGIAGLLVFCGSRWGDRSYGMMSGFDFAGVIFGIFAGCVLLVTVISLIPFAPKYWVLTEHNGTIATLSNRFVDGTGDITNTTYTLTLDGENTPLVVNDSRVTGLKVGQNVSLTCSLEWVYGGADRANCYLRSF